MVLTALLNETVGGSTVIANADDTNAFTSESLVSSTANTFNPANISLMARVLSIQLAGSYFSAGEALTIDLTTASAATPEPRTTGLIRPKATREKSARQQLCTGRTLNLIDTRLRAAQWIDSLYF